MKDTNHLFAHPDTPIIKTIEIIDRVQLQIAIVVDDAERIQGVVTDGDVRRAILKGISLNDPVSKIMNSAPVVATTGTSRKAMLEMMRAKQLRQLPVVDLTGRVMGIEVLEELLQPEEKDNWVVLMAGGLGSRLRPLTDDCPKPLLPVGNRPLLETIVRNFAEFGFRKFFLSVNYKAEMIKNHFGDGTDLGVQIVYLEESEFMGTAGALSLLPNRPTQPFFVMNGDLLTKVNFQQLLQFHVDQSAKATMCVREYDFQIPYGVVRLEHEKITTIEEKPLQRFFVNGGIYVLDPSILELVSAKQTLDMPSLFQKLIDQNEKTVAFPIREYWMDIGQISDLERAKNDFVGLFK